MSTKRFIIRVPDGTTVPEVDKMKQDLEVMIEGGEALVLPSYRDVNGYYLYAIETLDLD